MQSCMAINDKIMKRTKGLRTGRKMGYATSNFQYYEPPAYEITRYAALIVMNIQVSSLMQTLSADWN